MELQTVFGLSHTSSSKAFMESVTPSVLSPAEEEGSGSGVQARTSTDVDYIVNGVIIPSIAICGIIGNILNLLMLSWRYNKREADVLEKGVLLGLIALAVSDMMFCIVILPHMFFYKQKTAFSSRSFCMFYHVYGLYFQNVFIKTSTFLTLVIGVARYFGICHPLHARLFIGLNGMRITCIMTYILWFLLMSPMLWMYTIQEYPISNTSYIYITDIGPFAASKNLSTAFTYVWAFLGYFLPISILSVCNVSLICALRQSSSVHRSNNHSTNNGNGNGGGGASDNRDVSFRITLTLILLILMFMLLVSPSEILHFVHEVFDKEQYWHYEVSIMFTNVLQAINFAFHFVLYCVVNVTFRKIVLRNIYLLVGLFRKSPGSANHVTSGRCQHSLLLMDEKGKRFSFKSSYRTSVCRMGDNDTFV